jgi:hypothetical protein
MSVPRDPLQRRETEQRLTDRMNVTYELYLAARTEFARLMAQTPLGAIGSDSTVHAVRIHEAGQQQLKALSVYQAALRQFTDFVIHGVEPDVPSDAEQGG